MRLLSLISRFYKRSYSALRLIGATGAALNSCMVRHYIYTYITPLPVTLKQAYHLRSFVSFILEVSRSLLTGV